MTNTLKGQESPELEAQFTAPLELEVVNTSPKLERIARLAGGLTLKPAENPVTVEDDPKAKEKLEAAETEAQLKTFKNLDLVLKKAEDKMRVVTEKAEYLPEEAKVQLMDMLHTGDDARTVAFVEWKKTGEHPFTRISFEPPDKGVGEAPIDYEAHKQDTMTFELGPFGIYGVVQPDGEVTGLGREPVEVQQNIAALAEAAASNFKTAAPHIQATPDLYK
jgi:hypothetical protein